MTLDILCHHLTAITQRHIRECRHCGERVDRGADTCTECGASEIAEYTFC